MKGNQTMDRVKILIVDDQIPKKVNSGELFEGIDCFQDDFMPTSAILFAFSY
jgi:hypothetical protein